MNWNEDLILIRVAAWNTYRQPIRLRDLRYWLSVLRSQSGVVPPFNPYTWGLGKQPLYSAWAVVRVRDGVTLASFNAAEK